MKTEQMLKVMTKHLSDELANNIIEEYYYETLTSEVYYDNSVEYGRYYKMLNRCHNKSSKSYVNYGERGIEVCDRWRGRYGFKNFCDDMGICPEGMSLERIDVDKGYSPHNCRWATSYEQTANRRSFGQTKFSGISKTPNGFRARIFRNKVAIFDKHFTDLNTAINERNNFIIKNNLPHKIN